MHPQRLECRKIKPQSQQLQSVLTQPALTEGARMNLPTHTAAALNRLFEVAKHDTGQSTRLAAFLLAWGNEPIYGGFNLVNIRTLDEQIVRDMKTLLDYLFDVGFKYPSDIGYEADFVEVARIHRPDVCRVSDAYLNHLKHGTR